MSANGGGRCGDRRMRGDFRHYAAARFATKLQLRSVTATPMLADFFSNRTRRSMDIELARFNMIENQVRASEVLDPRVLDVLPKLRRERFVPAAHRHLAFAEIAIPLGHGEVMMTPETEGRTLQSIDLEGSERVLEIGTGSGFLTACLAHLAHEVVSVELHADLVDAARAALADSQVRNARVDHADAVLAWTTDQRFDVVVVTGAVHAVPQRFFDWVAPGGRLFAIVGESPALQAMLYRNADAGGIPQSLFETCLPFLTHAAPPARFSL
jgi:protein-L-isoaspartate(D-aspartate) O-methyltransferase